MEDDNRTIYADGDQPKKKAEPKEMTLEEYNAQKKAKAEAAKAAAAAKKAAQPAAKPGRSDV